LVEYKIRVFVDKLLHSVLHKLVKGIKLLPHETFLFKEAGNDGPAILLGYLLVFFLLFF
jgi:hypothetical protein